MKNKRRENSIRSLANLYTVVIGVALSLSAVQLMNQPKGIFSISLIECFLFLAFVSTLVPFYHGALRHLDDAYLENSTSEIKDGALIFDVSFLIVHGMVFIGLSLLLDNPSQFAWILIGLIAVDVVWGWFVHYAASSKGSSGVEGTWAWLNFVFVLLGSFLLFISNISLKSDSAPTKVAFGILIACLLRTAIDYKTCWKFYFPDEEENQES